MKRFTAIGIFFLALTVISSTSCGSAEWKEARISGREYWFVLELPVPFKNADNHIPLESNRQPLEYSYVADGDDDHKFQVRSMDMLMVTWQDVSFDRRAVFELALSRQHSNSSDKIVDRHDFTDPNWPEDNVPLAEELTIESADGKTIKHSRVLLYQGREMSWGYLVLTATRPKDKPRSPDVDRFFNSFKICTGDQRPGRC